MVSTVSYGTPHILSHWPIKLNRKNLICNLQHRPWTWSVKRHQWPRKNQVWLMIEMIKHGLQMNPLGNLWINPLDAAISMHVLYTVFYTFHKVLTENIQLFLEIFFNKTILLTKPFDHIQNSCKKLFLFLLWVCVIISQVANTIVGLRRINKKINLLIINTYQ